MPMRPTRDFGYEAFNPLEGDQDQQFNGGGFGDQMPAYLQRAPMPMPMQGGGYQSPPPQDFNSTSAGNIASGQWQPQPMPMQGGGYGQPPVQDFNSTAAGNIAGSGGWQQSMPPQQDFNSTAAGNIAGGGYQPPQPQPQPQPWQPPSSDRGADIAGGGAFAQPQTQPIPQSQPMQSGAPSREGVNKENDPNWDYNLPPNQQHLRAGFVPKKDRPISGIEGGGAPVRQPMINPQPAPSPMGAADRPLEMQSGGSPGIIGGQPGPAQGRGMMDSRRQMPMQQRGGPQRLGDMRPRPMPQRRPLPPQAAAPTQQNRAGQMPMRQPSMARGVMQR